MRVGRLCYEQGLQVAFEVGGRRRRTAARRWRGCCRRSARPTSRSRAEPDQPRPQEGRASCTTAPGATGRDCVRYELNNGDGWLQLASVAVLRNEFATFIEVAFKLDLLGRRHTSRWGEAHVRLLVPRQRRRRDEHAAGVGRFLPARPRPGWNDGLKGQTRPRPARWRRRRACGGGGAGAYFGGFFTAVALAVVGVVLKSRHANSAWPFNGYLPGGFPRPGGGGGGGGGGGMRGGLAAADSYRATATAPPLTATGPECDAME